MRYRLDRWLKSKWLMLQHRRTQKGHLGGYCLGGDPNSHYPEMWRWLVQRFQIRSVLDVGCGEGQSTAFFQSLGCKVLGLEGMPQTADFIVRHDYATGPYVPAEGYDPVWSCEFVEHIEEKYLDHFLATFQAARKFLVMTHALPGQPGYHHVNCQTEDYWIGKVEPLGFELHRGLTARTRQLAHAYYARSGLVFRHKEYEVPVGAETA